MLLLLGLNNRTGTRRVRVGLRGIRYGHRVGTCLSQSSFEQPFVLTR